MHMGKINAAHTKGPWKSKKWDSINYAIVPSNQKNGLVVALVQFAGVGGPAKDAERAANIRLIEEAPFLFDVLCKAHDLSLDGKHEEARDWMRAAIEAVEQERQPDNY